MRGMTAFVLIGLCVAAAPPEGGDARKAKSYLREVKKHLLESYIDSDRMEESKLAIAAIRAMAAAMDHKDFASVEEGTRRAVRNAVRARVTVEEAIDAAGEAASDLDLVKLADHGTQAMVRQTGDPFSRILTQEDMMKLLKLLQGGGKEEALGCAIVVKEGKATVYYVQYGTAAYEEGIEIGDEVVELRGRKAAELKPEEISELARLVAGETIEIKIARNGREYPFRIAARGGPGKSVRSEYLGRGIGYLRLTMFDNNLVREARQALVGMEAAGMKALILDLRHNPGGALPAATGVADLFLKQGLTISKTESHYRPSIGGFRLPGFGGDVEFKSKVRSEFEEMPMVCLINGASASASELLAGALRDHRRAVMIGEKTYGKGVGQTPILLSSMGSQRYLYLTVMRFLTPAGAEVNHKGVPADVVCREERLAPDAFQEAWRLRSVGRLDAYLDGRWGDAMRKLAGNDGFDASRYEGFDALYADLKTTLSRDDLRAELRRAARRRASQEEGTAWVCDLQTDRVLQRGLVELLDTVPQEK